MQKLKSKVEICKLPSMTPVFLPRYREARKLPPSPRWSPSQRPSSRLGNSVDSSGPSPRASGSPVKPLVAKPLPDRSPPSSLSSFRPKHHARSLRYTVVATPQMWLMWSRKTTSPSEYKHGAQAPFFLRYANLSKH